MSVMPRLANAAMKSDVAHHLVAFQELVDGEVGLHTGDVLNDSTRSSPTDTALVSGVVGALQADHLGAAGRSRSAIVERRQLGFVGSTSSTEAIRQPTPTPCSRCRIAATAVNSSADNGSVGNSPDHAITSADSAQEVRLPSPT